VFKGEAPHCISNIWWKFSFTSIFVAITVYPLCRMFKQYLVFVLVSQMAFSLFRLSAAVGRTMVTAFILGVFALVILQGLGGFNLSKSKIQAPIVKINMQLAQILIYYSCSIS